MQNSYHSAIVSRREVTEARLSALLEEMESKTTIDRVKKYIYESTESLPSAQHVIQLYYLCRTDRTPQDDSVILGLLLDAWNYFPHSSLSGRSPVEVLLEARDGDEVIEH
jgi:hypothetical protein